MSTQNEFPLSRLFQNFLYVLFFMCRRLNAVQIKHFKIWLYINTIFGPKLISMKKKKTHSIMVVERWNCGSIKLGNF